MSQAHPAGWWSDPEGSHELRYFDGAVWTDYVADQGTMSRAPLRPITTGEVVWLAARAGAAFVATFIASWWLIGDLTEASIRPDDITYVMRAPVVPSAALAIAGAASIGIAVAIAVSLFVARPRARARREAAIVVALAAAGIVLAGAGRMETAGSRGANIGGGLGIMLGGPIVVLLFAYALREFGKIRSVQRSRRPAAVLGQP